MNVAFLDCFSGISGDMVLGAMVDCGLPLNDLEAELRRLPVAGWGISARTVDRAGFRATKVDVDAPEKGQPQRGLADILGLIDGSGLPAGDRERAGAVFRLLAEAEAEVHGVPLEAVHFHEAGALDSIVDVVGAVVGLRLLGVERLYCSPLPASEGEIRTRHGVIPSPGPATLAVLARAGAPLRPTDVRGELVTPTGAAIVAALAAFERPEMVLRETGYGAGSKDLEGRPNVLRLWLGEARASTSRRMLLLESNIDDMTPEMLAFAQERLFSAGAVDVWMQPIQMKKGRPGVMLSALCREEGEQAVAEAFLRETSTLGVRVREVWRHEAEREPFSFESSLGTASVKVKRLPSGEVFFAPEFESCREAAERTGLPLAEVYRLIEMEARTAWR